MGRLGPTGLVGFPRDGAHQRNVEMGVFAYIRVLAVAVAMGFATQADAAEVPISNADLTAALRALGFLDSLPHDGQVRLAVVYVGSSSEGKSQALQVASALNAMQGPNSATLHADAIAADGLAQTSGRLDALFLLPGSSSTAPMIGEFIKRRRVVSISNDPSCLGARCCVLMVRTSGNVEIVLDTALADSVGARFSTVFSMMVKRK